MQEKPKSPSLKSWLDNIQQESWQLELVISGFSIFLLIGGWGWLKDLEYDLILLQYSSRSANSFNILYYISRTAYLALLSCLLIHVVMRGLWIAAIGLRSVSGDIEYQRFRYLPRFVKRLEQRLGSFDDYISRLERNCSVLFSLAFLILFCFMSIVLWSAAAILLQSAYLWFAGGTWQGQGVLGGAGIISLLVFIAGVIYMIDFVTLGLLKRIPYVGKVYYYLYVLMGWITLARIYRPLYYNLIDNRFGRKLAVALPFIIVLLLILVSVKHIQYSYYPVLIDQGEVWIDHNNYDDAQPNPFDQVWRGSIPSKFISNNYVELFLPYKPAQDDARLKKVAPDLAVSQYVGTKLHGAFSVGQRFNFEADYPAILDAFSQLTQLSVNDSIVKVHPRFTYHAQREQPGLLFMIPAHDLPAGEHRLMIQTRIFKEGEDPSWSSGRIIYFYK